MFATMKVGAIPILALPAHRENELDGIVKNSQPKAYIIAEKYMGFNYLDLAKKLQSQNECLRYLIVDGQSDSEYLTLNSIKSDSPVDVPTNVDAYQMALMLLSGGSSSVPKLIPRTHADYLYNAYCSAKQCRLSQNDVYLGVLPIAHNFPLACPGVLGTFYVGGEVVLCETASPDEILTNVSEYHVTVTALVPTLADMCIDMLEWDDSFDVSTLKKLQVGGAMLETSLAERIENAMPHRLMQVYGMSEGILCFTDYDDCKDVVVECQGKPVSKAYEVAIVNDLGERLGVGVDGELITKGAYMLDGYYAPDSVNAQYFDSDGYYHTGDIAHITPEGNVRIMGRLTEVINRAGEKINPSELEELLCTCPSVKRAVVVGVPDEALGTKVYAVLCSEDGTELDYLQVCKFLTDKGLAQFKIPDEIVYLQDLPLTAVGKVNKKLLCSTLQ
jgi:yersiniabactin salicyl-AMP ligase